MEETKSHPISKWMVWTAYQKVRENDGGAGIDNVSILKFDTDRKANLYKLWNRLSSGSYFPPSVKEVEIPKPQGGVRKLGIPTVSDRIAQQVVKEHLEVIVDPIFDASSYGYRPNKSAHQAVEACMQNCWKASWVIDLDIKGFFDNISHELMMKAVSKHTNEKWVLMYVERWLKANVITKKGEFKRGKGTPQGGVISPLLSNLYLHYTFDKWMRINYPLVSFERYADDIVVHCVTKSQAESLLVSIKKRLEECCLEVHPEKTKIVYCKKINGNEAQEIASFDFLGFTFKPRCTRNKFGNRVIGFTPAVSNKAILRMKDQVKEMEGKLNSLKTIEEVAKTLNPRMRGWYGYYGKFRAHELDKLWQMIRAILVKWIRVKYKKMKGREKKAGLWLKDIYKQNPKLFVYWEYSKP